MNSEELDEIKRHFNGVAERLESKIALAVEVLDSKIEAVDGKVSSLRIEMRDGFDEVKAMIKFSYAELDRRISTLETSFARLDARVGKLEAN